MAIRKYKPTTPGRRGSSVADFAEITRTTPEKSLVRPLPKKGGRNNQGRITTRHQGGGHKRAYRIIDFRRYDKDGVPAKVAHIEYDPNRTARIALLHYADGEKRYIIAPNKLKQGDVVENGAGADIKPGNNLPLRNIPTGTVIHAIELKPGGGAKIARSAGNSAQLVAKEGSRATLRMPGRRAMVCFSFGSRSMKSVAIEQDTACRRKGPDSERNFKPVVCRAPPPSPSSACGSGSARAAGARGWRARRPCRYRHRPVERRR